MITWQTWYPSPLPFAINQAPCSKETFLKALWSSSQWVIAARNEMFSQSLLALLLSRPGLPITLSVAHVTAELFALPSTMITINGPHYTVAYLSHSNFWSPSNTFHEQSGLWWGQWGTSQLITTITWIVTGYSPHHCISTSNVWCTSLGIINTFLSSHQCIVFQHPGYWQQ